MYVDRALCATPTRTLGPPARGTALVMQLPQRESDLLVWLCRLMASVVEREADNRMGPKVDRMILSYSLCVTLPAARELSSTA